MIMVKQNIKDKTITIELYKGVKIEFYDTETDEIYELKGKPRNVFRIDYCKQGILGRTLYTNSQHRYFYSMV